MVSYVASFTYRVFKVVCQYSFLSLMNSSPWYECASFFQRLEGGGDPVTAMGYGVPFCCDSGATL